MVRVGRLLNIFEGLSLFIICYRRCEALRHGHLPVVVNIIPSILMLFLLIGVVLMGTI